jgi:hypothetical protein
VRVRAGPDPGVRHERKSSDDRSSADHWSEEAPDAVTLPVRRPENAFRAQPREDPRLMTTKSFRSPPSAASDSPNTWVQVGGPFAFLRGSPVSGS